MPSPAPRIATQLVEPLVDWLISQGAGVDGLLRSMGLTLHEVRSPSAMIPLAAYVELFEQAARVSGDPHFGLHLGRFEEPGSVGALGYLFMSGASLLDAFEDFSAHLDALQEDTANRVVIDGDTITFQYRINDIRIAHRRQDSEYSIAAMHSLARAYSAARIVPMRICFEHRHAGRYSHYHDWFQCDVHFGQPFNALIYRREGFNVRSRRPSQLLNPIIASHLDRLAARKSTPRSYHRRVSELIDLHMVETDCSQARVAKALGISVSTLIRKLRTEGHSFRKLLMERRLQYAEWLLTQDETPVASIALAVGYAENASFTRAFQRRHAQSPAQFRRSQRRIRTA